MSEILSQISDTIIEGNVEDIVDLTEEALDDGSTAQEILNLGLMAGMDHVGVEFKAGNMFVPEVLRSAKAMQIRHGATAAAPGESRDQAHRQVAARHREG